MEQNATAEITKEQVYKDFQKMLLDNPKLMAEKMKSFESAFGKNTKTRTRKQWANLVRVYGIDSVCQNESLTAEEVQLKCTETLTQRLNRVNRIRATIK